MTSITWPSYDAVVLNTIATALNKLMTPACLQDFLSTLEASGELARVSVSVDPMQEIAAITDRVCKQPGGGKALLFEQPAGCDHAVITNLFGSRERVCRALGVSTLDELTARMSKLLGQIAEPEVSALDRQIAALPEFQRFTPRPAENPDAHLVQMNPPDLTHFPFLQNWPGDGAADACPRYITLGQIITTDPEGGSPNCGLYRVQLRGPDKLAIQWKAGSNAARHADLYRRQGKPMPVAIVLGGDPAVLFSAMCPLPGNLDELAFAGFLRGRVLQTADCTTVPLQVPTGAEAVIEGFVEPVTTVMEGPFGNHTGCYSPAAPAALMQVSAVRQRAQAVIPATVVGPPPMEDCWMAQVWERILLAFLHRLAPPVKELHIPFEWAFRQSAIISLENPQPGMVQGIADLLWSLPWFAGARLLLFVSAQATASLSSLAAWQAINLTDYQTDIMYDQSGGRVAVDATGSHLPRTEVSRSPRIMEQVDRRWQEYGFA